MFTLVWDKDRTQDPLFLIAPVPYPVPVPVLFTCIVNKSLVASKMSDFTVTINGVITLGVSGTGTGTRTGTRNNGGTVDVGTCPCSGAVWKILYKTLQPIHPCLSAGPSPLPGDGQCDWTIVLSRFNTFGFFILNLILSDLTILCRFGLRNLKTKYGTYSPVGMEPRPYDSKSSMLPLP